MTIARAIAAKRYLPQICGEKAQVVDVNHRLIQTDDIEGQVMILHRLPERFCSATRAMDIPLNREKD